MRILVAGATGAIGRPLVERLVADGHDVHGMTRKAERGQALEALGAHAVVADALDAAAVDAAVDAVCPDVVIAELTSLPADFQPRRIRAAYAANDRVRLEGTRNLRDAALRHGVKKIVVQGSAFWYAPTPGMVKTEADPLWTEAPGPMGTAIRTMVEMERLALEAEALSPLVLRYGTFYGPGTWFAPDGTVGRLMKKRQYPIIGDGAAVSSFVHVDDAATATAQAVKSDATGVLNIVDEEPAAAHVWMPAFAAALAAPRPPRVPVWLARLAIGGDLVTFTTNMRGADGTLARERLDWSPRYASWREGFPAAVAA